MAAEFSEGNDFNSKNNWLEKDENEEEREEEHMVLNPVSVRQRIDVRKTKKEISSFHLF